MRLRWYLRSSVNERICYKSCAVTYHSLAAGSLDFHPEDQREVSPELGIYKHFDPEEMQFILILAFRVLSIKDL